MRVISLSEGVDINRVVRAATAELESHVRERGSLKDAFLVMSVKVCSEVGGAVPLIEDRPRQSP
jgi:hypothetical protein